MIHHQGVLEHFTALQIRAALAQQVAVADWVVFSVPSVYYPFEPEFGDERLLPLEEWQRLLEPFAVEELRYYGDPQLGEREHVLCVLRGQQPDDRLMEMMHVPERPYPTGISAIVHTRNEGRQIRECLQTLVGCADEIIVCDMESTDNTVEIASTFTDQILHHPKIDNFDRARNVSAMRAQFSHVFYLDADERVPEALAKALRHLVQTQGDTFEGMLIPFRHHFAGHWMRSLYPGYTTARLFKNGEFVFNARLHSGARVNGRTILFPADNPDLALTHYSFDSLSHYLEKLNRYTDGEAANMHKDGQPFHWQRAIHHFVQDFQSYYDQGGAPRDGVHGFLYSFLSAFYRFEQHAKLYELRYREGKLQPQETVVPGSVAEILRFALQIAEQPAPKPAPQIRVEPNAKDAASVVWSGPHRDQSGYGEESRNFLFALDQAGFNVAAHPLIWSEQVVDMTAYERKRLDELMERPVAPGFVQIIQDFPPAFARHPEAGMVIGRTMFETDRLPQSWVTACNQMDYIWVPSEFNRQTFAAAGVALEKLVVVPGCFDPVPYAQEIAPTPLSTEIDEEGKFVFLTVFDWTRHKGWDVLLRAFLEAFEGRDDVRLVLKVWSTMGYTPESLQEQARAFVREALGQDLAADKRVRFVTDRMSRADLLALYRASDAFVLPSRGEGWGRPYMEAMALGLPTIGTNWSGNTAFMTPENSYLIDCKVVDVPEVGWREIPTYQGHRWAEPDREHLKQLLLQVVEDRDEAAAIGERGRDYVHAHFTRALTPGPFPGQSLRLLGEGETRTLTSPPGAQATNSIDQSDNTDPTQGQVPISPESNVNFPPSPGSGSDRPGKGPGVRATTDGSALSATASKLIIPPSLAKRGERPGKGSGVRWEGAQFSWHSLAHVNREFCLELLGSGKVELSLVPTEPMHFDPSQEPRFKALAPLSFAPLSRPADIHVRHFFPPRLDAPEEGKLVLVQPWEYGYLPKAWIEPILANVEEVWCYSEYVRQVYLASGIPAERLQVVRLGVDTAVFNPQAPPYVFTTEPGVSVLPEGLAGRFVFLFVGGTLHRKGIDILLEAYLKAFLGV